MMINEQLRQALSLKPRQFPPANGERLAAILIPMFWKESEYHILFTKRTQLVHVHRGEVSFPGGGYEDRDGSLFNTALRESEEEIGIPSRDIEILGELDSATTASSGYLISSFVGIIPWPHTLKLEPWEIEEAFDAPISALMDKGCFRQEVRVRDGKSTSIFYYDYQGRTIWGATGRILNEFLNVYARAMRGFLT